LGFVLVFGTPETALPASNIDTLYEQITSLVNAGSTADAIPLAELFAKVAMEKFGENNPNYAIALNYLGMLYQKQGRLGEAEPLYKRALAIYEKALPEGHPDIVISLANLAAFYQGQGRLSEAEPLYKRALTIREKALPEGHPDIAASLNNLASLYYNQGQLSEAEPLYKRALKIREKALPKDHPDIAQTLNNLASLYQKEGRLSDAEPLFKRALAIREKALPEDHSDIAQSLNNLASLYQKQGRLSDAEPLFKRALALYEKALPEGHSLIALSLNNLALLYQDQGRLSEAEPLYKRALAIREKALPEGHPDIAVSLNNLAYLFKKQGRLSEAEPLYKRTLAIRDKALPKGHPDIATSLNNLAGLYEDQGRLSEAEPLYKRALAIREKALPEGHSLIALSCNNLASHYEDQGRLSEAEPLFKRALAIYEKALPEGHPDIAMSLNNLATLYEGQGRLSDAEPLFKRALAIREKALPEGHSDIAQSLNNLALLYKKRGRLSEAEPLFKRALALYEKALPEGHPDIATGLNNLASLFYDQGRLSEAETLFKRALAIRDKALPKGHPDIATSLDNLAGLYEDQGRLSDAEPLYKRALAIREKALPEGHRDIAMSCNNLASLYKDQGRLSEAEPLYKRALAIREKALPEGHPDIAMSLGNLSALFHVQKDWPQALNYMRRAAGVLAARAVREGAGSSGNKRELKQNTNLFRAFLAVAYHTDAADPTLRDEGFQMAQWATRTEAAEAIAQMAARQAAGDDELAKHIREGQDIQRQSQSADQRLSKALGEGSKPAADAARKEMAGLDEKLKAINTGLTAKFKENPELAAKFRKYMALVNPPPLSIAQTQARLHADEALLQISSVFEIKNVPAESFAWAVTKTQTRWVRLSLDPAAIAERLATLRCGLDQSQWGMGEPGQEKLARRCKKLIGLDESPQYGDLLPFRLDVAHELYEAVLGPFEDLVKSKHLIVVADGALATLPIQVLTTEKSAISLATKSDDFRSAAWLGVRQPVSVLPSVSNLDDLRKFTKGGAGDKPYIGFGNPLLVGRDGKDRRAFAQDANSCRTVAPDGLAHVETATLNQGAPPLVTRGGSVNVDEVRKLPPLPETTQELCVVAASLGASQVDIHVGDQATEAVVNEMSASGQLARARVVHFATHALLPGGNTPTERGLIEPALVLTSPAGGGDKAAPDLDDGLLMASEVAQLKLNADWVVLSACNTAGGDKQGGEALSGLARAFFYAGARALLVSHWEVDSNAAAQLTTHAFGQLKDHPEIGRAEALRRSEIAMITHGGADAHPSRWAPFVIVGEGAGNENIH